MTVSSARTRWCPAMLASDRMSKSRTTSPFTRAKFREDVFLGPSCVLTNVTNPRSQVNRRHLYERTLIRRGATVGANATVVSGSRSDVMPSSPPAPWSRKTCPTTRSSSVSPAGSRLDEPPRPSSDLTPAPALMSRVGVRLPVSRRGRPLPRPRRGSAAPGPAFRGHRTYDEFKSPA